MRCPIGCAVRCGPNDICWFNGNDDVRIGQRIMTDDWQPIDTAPRDGRIVKMRRGSCAPFHAFWSDGRWLPIEYQHGLPATQWEVESD